MADKEIYEVKGIGEIKITRSARAKRIIISVRPGQGVRIALPKRASVREALDFLQKKKKWVLKHLEKIQAHEERKKEAGSAYEALDKKEARQRIVRRLKELARQHDFAYGKVTLRNQRTRWGSCSSRNNISLNLKLAMLPPEMTDYVLLHELVHTRIHNHSQRFWAELDKYVGNGKTKAKKMREYGAGML